MDVTTGLILLVLGYCFGHFILWPAFSKDSVSDDIFEKTYEELEEIRIEREKARRFKRRNGPVFLCGLGFALNVFGIGHKWIVYGLSHVTLFNWFALLFTFCTLSYVVMVRKQIQ